MRKALEFLATHKDVAMATVEGNKPKIRVFQIMKQEGDTLYFATAARKAVYRQLQENPAIELLAMEGNISVRITGKAVFDVSDPVQKEIYETNAGPVAALSKLFGHGLFSPDHRRAGLL